MRKAAKIRDVVELSLAGGEGLVAACRHGEAVAGRDDVVALTAVDQVSPGAAGDVVDEIDFSTAEVTRADGIDQQLDAVRQALRRA